MDFHLVKTMVFSPLLRINENRDSLYFYRDLNFQRDVLEENGKSLSKFVEKHFFLPIMRPDRSRTRDKSWTLIGFVVVCWLMSQQAR